MRICKICGESFDPDQPLNGPAQEAGAFLARELWKDAGELCPTCLANRGTLGMMYCRELS